MKVSIAQLNFIIGDYDGNTKKMIQSIQSAKENGADIVCFSELATCGYPPRDFLEFDDFIGLSEQAIQRLSEHSHDIGIVVGAPSRNCKPEGKDLFNSAYFLYNGEVQFVQHKTLLPTYDIFDEYRYFEPAKSWNTFVFRGKKIALTVCEDIWDINTDNPLYNVVPLDEMMKDSPDFIINVSASPFSYKHGEARLNIIKANAERYKIPMFYINHVGAQTEVLFDGGSVVISGNGTVVDEMPYFEECQRQYNLDEVIACQKDNEQEKEKIALIHDALVMGVRDYFEKLGFSKAILGLSGGIDSAVTLVIAARALGPENVRVLLMPSQFSSDHSVKDAEDLANNLGVEYNIIPIKGLYEGFLESLNPIFEDKPFNVAEENIQARIRGILNMAISNKFGNILLNTTNKSEMAVGYGTLYGDLCGGLSVIGDVYKMDVFKLARYMNKDGEVIPENSIIKPPSAELRPNQKDSDSLPDYEILDQILHCYIEGRMSPEEIIEQGFDEKVVKRTLRLVNINEFKRHQTAPVLRVSPKAFGMGRRMPIVGKYLS